MCTLRLLLSFVFVVLPTIKGLSEESMVVKGNGGNIVLKCDADGSPAPYQTWFKRPFTDDKLIPIVSGEEGWSLLT